MRRSGLAALLLILALSSVRAQAPHRAHDITVDDYFTLDVLTAQQISPDGRHVAYTLARWDRDSDGRRTDLWVVSCDTKRSRRLTFDHAGIAAPRWAEDGKTVYFLGRLKREGEKNPPLDGTAQVWRVAVEGGEPLAVTRVSGGVTAFDLARYLYYQVDADRTDDEFAALKRQFKVDYGHGTRKASQ